MDASNYRRRETQTQRPINNRFLGNAAATPAQPKAPLLRPLDMRAPADKRFSGIDPSAISRMRVRGLDAPSLIAGSAQPTQSMAAPVRMAAPAPQPMAAPTQLRPVAAPAPVMPTQISAPRPTQLSSMSFNDQPAPMPVAVGPAAPSALEIAEAAQVNAPKKRLSLDMSLPGEASAKARHQLSVINGFLSGSKVRFARTWGLRAGIGAAVLVVAIGGVLASQGAFKLHKVFKGGTKTAAALTKNVNPALLKGEGDGRINVLLLGRGGGTHDGPDLTDTMMLDSIDPVNHTSTLLSIPRDLWVQVPNAGTMKINAAWETGEFKYEGKVDPGSTDPKAIQAGFDLADQTVESVFDVPIDYNVIVDFDAFKQAITTVGGVQINVPTDLVDPTMKGDNFGNPIIAKAGIQTLAGQQALNYVRSRETTSDFARAQRQRAVLVALKDKVESLGTLSDPLKISSLVNAFGNNVSSDLSLTDAERLYKIISTVPDSATNSIGLADAPNKFVTTGTAAGQSIDLPTAGLNNYTAIQDYVHSQLKDGYIIKENASVQVLNGTTLAGVATTEANVLKNYGYNVVGAANTPTTGWTETQVIDLSGGKDPYTKHYLEQRFNVTAKTAMPDSSIPTNGANFVIIIGSDEANATTGTN